MNNHFKNLFLKGFLSALFSFLSITAQAMVCGNFLDSQSIQVAVELPGKGNTFTKRAFEALSPENQKLLRVVESAVKALNLSSVQSALVELNQPLTPKMRDNDLPAFLTEFARNRSNESTIHDNFHYFQASLKQEFSEDVLIGLSILFSNVNRKQRISAGMLSSEKGLGSEVIDGTNKGSKMLKGLAEIANQPLYANAIINLLKSEYLAPKIQARIKEIDSYMLDGMVADYESGKSLSLNPEERGHLREQIAARFNKSAETDAESIETYYKRTGKLKKEHTGFVIEALMVVTELFTEDFIGQMGSKSNFIARFFGADDLTFTVSDERGIRINLYEQFLVETAGRRTNVEVIAVLLDHIMHSSALPLTSHQLEQIADQSLKSALIAPKSERSRVRIERREKEIEASIVPQPDFKIVQEDTPVESQEMVGAEPKPNPKKRRNKPPSNKNTEIASDSLDQMPLMIPEEQNLLNFTAASENPRSISEISDTVVYKFRFLREKQDSQVKTVEFNSDVVKEFKDDPELAGKFLLAFNMGMAVREHQDGLKILKENKNGSLGRNYELKTRKSAKRIIVRHIDGHWIFLKVTDKKSMDRVLRTID